MSETDPEITALRQRLALAESVCVLYGWTGSRPDSDRDKALFELWSMWAKLPGTDTSPEGNPELTDALISDLARRRDETRAQVLAKLWQIPVEDARKHVEQEGHR
jgi:hypothetical protein